jgi:hypothetical protein
MVGDRTKAKQEPNEGIQLARNQRVAHLINAIEPQLTTDRTEKQFSVADLNGFQSMLADLNCFQSILADLFRILGISKSTFIPTSV